MILNKEAGTNLCRPLCLPLAKTLQAIACVNRYLVYRISRLPFCEIYSGIYSRYIYVRAEKVYIVLIINYGLHVKHQCCCTLGSIPTR
jgi:hypothetical protein